MLRDCSDREILDGDIIDLHQTVNGQSLFVVASVENLDIRYHHDMTRRYEYDAKSLLGKDGWLGEVEYEVVGHVDSVPDHIPTTDVIMLAPNPAFDRNVIKKILEDYDRLSEELIRVTKIINPFARTITSIELRGDLIDVSYADYCMSTWGHDNSNIPIKLLGKSDDEIQVFLKEEKRINAERDRVAIEKLEEETRLKELAELARLNEKYLPKSETK